MRRLCQCRIMRRSPSSPSSSVLGSLGDAVNRFLRLLSLILPQLQRLLLLQLKLLLQRLQTSHLNRHQINHRTCLLLHRQWSASTAATFFSELSSISDATVPNRSSSSSSSSWRDIHSKDIYMIQGEHLYARDTWLES